MNIAMTARVAAPLAAARPRSALQASVSRFGEVGLPHVYSLGAGKKFFYSTAVVAWLVNALSIGVGGVLYGIAKVIGLAKERTAINDIASQIKTDQDKPLLRQAIREEALPQTLEARLTEKLKKRGIVV
ncbi:MAG: hypothetical protein WC632_02325 [Candidatus Margulisiibacteriota bacterium]